MSCAWSPFIIIKFVCTNWFASCDKVKLFHSTNLVSGSKQYHSTCIDRYGHNCLQIKIVHQYKLLTVLNYKVNQIIILYVVSGHLLSYYYNWFGDFKQNNYIQAKLWNTFSDELWYLNYPRGELLIQSRIILNKERKFSSNK